MPYKTRFNCSKRIKRLYAQYNGAWDNASNEYTKGIFLTLTTDPKRFGSLIKATKGMGQAWNRFLSWIGRQLVKCPKCGKIQPIDQLKKWGRTETRGQKKYFKCCDQPHRLTNNYHRPDYIKALEFDKGGKPHLHIAIFGCHWLTSKDQITKYWNRTGQGKINYLYPISYNERTDSWKWKNNNNRPSNSRKDVKNYMRKELGKAMGNMARLAFYWITQRRFFTTSKALKSKMPKTELEETLASPKWDFIGSFYYFKMPSYLNGKDPPPPPQSPKRNKEILARILEMPK